MQSSTKRLLAFAGMTLLTLCTLRAQDSSALVDALVKKGVLTQQEGEEIEADLTKEYAQTSASKLNVSSHIKNLTLYGDGRWRYEYNNVDNQSNANSSHVWRARYRIRLGADYAFTDQFKAGFELESSTQNDAAFQTVGAGFGKFSLNVGLLYLSYKPWDFVTLTGGKMKNPFYSTDMLWDPDIKPEGAAEIFSWNVDDALTVGLTAGQFNYTDNNESTTGVNANSSKDSWIFAAQIPVSYKVTKDVTALIAPSIYVWTPGSTLVNGQGLTAGSITSGAQPAVNGGSFSTGTPAFIDVNGASYLNVISAPGEVAFKAWNQKMRFYWDLVYNLTGQKRIDQAYAAYAVGSTSTYNPTTFRNRNSDLTDSAAWLVGMQIGDTKKKGDWSFSTDFRQVGLGSVDPNLADSEWGNGYLNQQGVKLTSTYNFTDFLIGGVNYYTTWNYKENLALPTGSAGNSLTAANATQRLQFELTWKF